MLANAYILAPTEDEDEGEGGTAPQPIIIAEMETQIPSVSVGDAVMRMELSGAQLLVFRNEGRGINVVYRREDGNIGWIDPGGNN